MPELDYLVVGHVTMDQGEREATMGGSATYAALIAAMLGKRVGLLTSASFEPGLIDVLGDVRVARLPADETTRFVNTYEGEVRTQKLEALAPSLSATQLLPEWKSAPIVHLAPVAQEVEGDFLNAFPKAFMGVTAQGWMRTWDDSGVIERCEWEHANAVLQRAQATVISAEDIAHPEDLPGWIEKARVLVVTHGIAGAVIYEKGTVTHSAAFQSTTEVDPTGAGDFFAAAFFIRLAETGDAQSSAEFANCVASFAVERRGHEAVPTRDQVEQRLERGKRRAERPPGL